MTKFFNSKIIALVVIVLLINGILYTKGYFDSNKYQWTENKTIVLIGEGKKEITAKIFIDYECNYSKELIRNALELKTEHLLGNVNLEIHNFPGIVINSSSFDQALLAECLLQEGVWRNFIENIWLKNVKYINYKNHLALLKAFLKLSEKQLKNIDNCFKAAEKATLIQSDILQATDKGYIGTPVIEIQGIKYEGALPTPKLIYLFNSYLQGEKPDSGAFSGSCGE